MSILSKIKKAVNIVRNIGNIVEKQQEILDRVRVINDNYVIEKHHEKFGIYTSSKDTKLKSSVCRMQDLLDNDKWVTEYGKNLTQPHLLDSDCIMNRKAWEYVFITQALYERGMLAKGKKGLGFAVGKEPLPALFAKYGCEIVATDIDSSTETGRIWTNAKQHGSSLDDLYKADLCDRKIFDKNVTFRFLDMNVIPDNFSGFDFVWSSCAFEHLGSIQKGKQFIYNMIKCLKSGGGVLLFTPPNIIYRLTTVSWIIHQAYFLDKLILWKCAIR